MAAPAPLLSNLKEAIEKRRSLHKLSAEIGSSHPQVEEIVQHAILHAPTPFNCQSGRAIVLTKSHHQKLWSIAYDVGKASVPPEVFESAFEPRIKMFSAAYGTVLFYESGSALKVVEERMPIIKDKIPQWSEHANGMLQYAVWTMLTSVGLGVNVQHYNPMIDDAVAKEWDVPQDWSLKAQMVFGKPVGPPLREKTFRPVSERVKMYSD